MQKRLVMGMVLGVVGLGFVAGPAHARAEARTRQPADVRVVSLNILHGITCGEETAQCQVADRVDLFAQQLEDSNCPEIVGLQEVRGPINEELARMRKTVCDGKYKLLFRDQRTGNTERVLTTLKVKSTKFVKLLGGLRGASRAVLRSPAGPVVVVVTHQDGDPETPSTTCSLCKPPCRTDRGAYDCQTDAAIGLANSGGGAKAIRVIMGDFNVESSSARYQRIVADGYLDSHLAAGNTECDPATGEQCTSGRDDSNVETLKDAAAGESSRIDFLFVKPGRGCEIDFDAVDDADGDGLATGLFFPEPTTGGPGGIVWTSDHTGVSADFSCKRGS